MKSLFGRSLISITDLSREEILSLLDLASKLKRGPHQEHLKGKILASCFFEPSTRTRLSFEAAMLRLGGSVIGFSDGEATSQKKGESLSDTIRVIAGYADVLVIRHPRDGAAQLADEVTPIPVINGGDGANEHPTQTLLDLFSIHESQGRLDGLNIAFLGDLKYGRTVHSLALIAGFFHLRLYFVSPEELMFPDHLCHDLRRAGVCFSFHRSIEEIMGKIDVIYATRIQKERSSSSQSYSLTLPQLKGAKETLKVLHPLPRVDELDRRIDKTPFAYYFEQAQNGLYVRMALLLALLKADQHQNLLEEMLCVKNSV